MIKSENQKTGFSQRAQGTQRKTRKASDIYNRQNVLIHKAMHDAGLPYAQNKDTWLNLMNEIRAQGSGRKAQGKCLDSTVKPWNDVEGLSDLTLAERHQLILHFQKQGMKLFSPSVPVNIRGWKKGDEDVFYEFRKDGDPQIAMIFAMWEEMGYTRKSLYGLCFKLFKKDHPRWLTDSEISHLVNVVRQKAQSKGMGTYYRA
ncbi:MAG: DUF1018 domain-containing protein [Deltaproteobacteria bacterium]|nr:DUF1018 domain-containing protein [Deltaproteobacteria bacterium]